MVETTISYGFNSREQSYVFKCNGQKVVLSVTHTACAKFMRYLAALQDSISKKSAMVADVETPYTITASNAGEQWELLYEAYRAEQAATNRAGNPAKSGETCV